MFARRDAPDHSPLHDARLCAIRARVQGRVLWRDIAIMLPLCRLLSVAREHDEERATVRAVRQPFDR